jgi:hypothetical protein
MTRTFIIVLASFFITGISYSKIITLKDCRGPEDKSFNKEKYEDYKFVIDADKKTVNQIYVWTDKEIERQKNNHQNFINKKKELGQSTKHLESLLLIDKMTIGTYQITHIDDDYVQAEMGKPASKYYISIFFKKKTAEGKYEQPDNGLKQQYSFICK